MGGNSIRNIGIARENGFFKVEQEADLQRHRKRLVRQGMLEELAGAHLRPRRQMTLQESANVFEVLPEVLQQQARVDDPDAAARQEGVRRIRGELPRLSAAELRQYRRSAYGLAALTTTPKMTFGRDRFHQAFRSAETAVAAAGASPQGDAALAAQRSAAWGLRGEVARRAYTVGLRSALYGGAGAVAGVTCVALLAVRVVAPEGAPASRDGLRAHLQDWLRPTADAVRRALLPLKASLEGVFGSGPEGQGAPSSASEEGGSGAAPQQDGGFSQALGDRLHRRYGRGRLMEGSGLMQPPPPTLAHD